ncbi:hypothetical protein AYM40_14215 [Paraburkholderia phytofirmans OLGA172]|uniref:Uncharacterized protein n=2 Tax=Paraburkholderia phytofirmans TaxID=261302 RepID=A0A160FMH8_9BURK|nr:hypothetical protein AYM40_14215 [Paraburkholderia phytofirmans OLGA172]
MVISPPFLPAAGLTSTDPTEPDPMMAAVGQFELLHHGTYPIAFDRRSHCGIHLAPSEQTEPVRAIADGEVIAYRVSKNAIADGQINPQTGNPVLNSNTGFVLLKHVTDTGDGRTITFYSLYMHLLDMTAQQNIAPQPTNPAQNSSPDGLPAWLLDTAGGKDGVARSGNGRKVYRKDMLGYWGSCHGTRHLHFEIFMTETDFTAWFAQDGHKVQLGAKNPVTPASKDYWGHSYFVIPGGQTFVSVPPGQHGSAYFPALTSGTLDPNSKLYVEAYFHKGERYTRSWVGIGDSIKPLTAAPVKDRYKEYEYNLYQRATDLYPHCPSDGYDMLRFGRILGADQQTLPASAPNTWVAVPFDENSTQGYIDISQDAIQKLSDADFPFFTGWKRIDDDNTPFGPDGLCGYDELCKITGVAEAQELPGATMPSEYSEDDQLAAYVRGKEDVLNSLKGFICHASSEWDAGNNDGRYGGLNEPDGFFGKRKDIDPDEYDKFVAFLKRFQFLEQTPLGGHRFWFFHPLAFIRHFRKCGWMSAQELAQCIPRKIVDQTRNQVNQTVFPRGSIGWGSALARVQRFLPHLNRAFRKYGLSSNGIRLSYFLGNAIQETTYLSQTAEGDGSHLSYAPWYGRGIIQLTHEENYKRYGDYRGWPGSASSYRDSLETDPARASDSAGFYWVSCAKPVNSAHNINVEADAYPIISPTTITNVCSSYDYHNRTCNTVLSAMRFRVCQQFERTARAVNTGSPNRTGAMYGLVPRTNVFLSSMAKLSDVLIDFEDAYAQKIG